MLVGEYKTKICNKKRVAIPKVFREELGEEIILTRGYENALILVNKEMWQKIANEVINGSFINKNIRDTTRFLVGSALQIEYDSQGRVVIPDNLKEHANLSKEIVFVGLYNWIEIWSKENWEKRLEYLKSNSEEIAQEIEKMNKKAE